MEFIDEVGKNNIKYYIGWFSLIVILVVIVIGVSLAVKRGGTNPYR